MVIGSILASTGSSLASMPARSLAFGGATTGGAKAGVGGDEPVKAIVMFNNEEEEGTMLKLWRSAPSHSSEGSVG